jgi:hypothetical protein
MDQKSKETQMQALTDRTFSRETEIFIISIIIGAILIIMILMMLNVPQKIIRAIKFMIRY